LYDIDCSSAEVEFHIRNEVPKIKNDSVTTYAELTGNDHEAQSHDYISKGWFRVDDAAYAERFAKAFKHAVALCGGQASRFRRNQGCKMRHPQIRKLINQIVGRPHSIPCQPPIRHDSPFHVSRNSHPLVRLQS
jgi:hypothetical protein